MDKTKKNDLTYMAAVIGFFFSGARYLTSYFMYYASPEQDDGTFTNLYVLCGGLFLLLAGATMLIFRRKTRYLTYVLVMMYFYGLGDFFLAEFRVGTIFLVIQAFLIVAVIYMAIVGSIPVKNKAVTVSLRVVWLAALVGQTVKTVILLFSSRRYPMPANFYITALMLIILVTLAETMPALRMYSRASLFLAIPSAVLMGMIPFLPSYSRVEEEPLTIVLSCLPYVILALTMLTYAFWLHGSSTGTKESEQKVNIGKMLFLAGIAATLGVLLVFGYRIAYDNDAGTRKYNAQVASRRISQQDEYDRNENNGER